MAHIQMDVGTLTVLCAAPGQWKDSADSSEDRAISRCFTTLNWGSPYFVLPDPRSPPQLTRQRRDTFLFWEENASPRMISNTLFVHEPFLFTGAYAFETRKLFLNFLSLFLCFLLCHLFLVGRSADCWAEQKGGIRKCENKKTLVNSLEMLSHYTSNRNLLKLAFSKLRKFVVRM